MITEDGWLDWADRRPGPEEKKYSTPCTSEFYIPHSMVGRLPGWYSRLFDMSKEPDGRFTANAAASVTGSILLDGRVIEHYPFGASCWGSGSFEANTRGNPFENESQYTDSRPDERKPFTDKQVESNLHIIRDMSQHFGWIPKRPSTPIVGPETPIPGVTLLQHNEAVRLFGGGITSCPSDRTRTLWAMIPEMFKQEDDMTTYKLFHTWGPARLWIIAYVAGVPIYRRWITTQAGAQVLIGELGQPETISENQLKTIPSL